MFHNIACLETTQHKAEREFTYYLYYNPKFTFFPHLRLYHKCLWKKIDEEVVKCPSFLLLPRENVF